MTKILRPISKTATGNVAASIVKKYAVLTATGLLISTLLMLNANAQRSNDDNAKGVIPPVAVSGHLSTSTNTSNSTSSSASATTPTVSSLNAGDVANLPAQSLNSPQSAGTTTKSYAPEFKPSEEISEDFSVPFPADI